MSTRVADVVEMYFSPMYLFAPENAIFREGISPKQGGAAPPMFAIENLIDDRNVVSACTAENVPTDDKHAMISYIASELQNSKVVEVVMSPKGRMCLRRRSFLTEDEDPTPRCVVLRPVHADASSSSISSYAKQYGDVIGVFRRASVRDGVIILFSKVSEAEACAAAKHSYGELPVACGQHFVPRLYASTLKAFYDHKAHAAKIALEQQLQKNIVTAQCEIAASTATSTTPATTTTQADNVASFAGRLVQAKGIADSTTWQAVKAKLGNLACNEPKLRYAIANVHIVEEGEGCDVSQPRTAFILMKSEDTARILVETFAKLEGGFVEGVKAICPSLQLPEGPMADW
eukprot:CAMPEP_0176409302 /NCGR_PEP_ID=MMETSP0127-20121128/2426_1 /TAXON_ID=938130 /ORGANISM="Platyophrya macrostoma, Strain WH" /LENGTH=345 /DNA_ID=CAMNT_0017788673 /DNA_START=293 /DNA_END=1327 /DNA_ORIENTATION=+